MSPAVLPSLRRFAAAAGDFLRGFLGLHATTTPTAGRPSAERARADLAERSARRPTCC